jgi:dephospho-CoA kinase
MPPVTIGLTGGIASGKSTVAGLFAELGVPVVDADAIAREVVEPGSEALREIVAELGESVLTPEGALDRKRVASIVFADASARKRLEAITHPRIAARSAEKISALRESGAPYVLYEAALLVENGSYRAFAALVVVSASEATQLARLVERDGMSEADARARLAAQLPLAEKVKVADWVIENDGTLPLLRERVRTVDAEIRERFGAAT